LTKTINYDSSNLPAIYSDARQLPKETMNLWLKSIQKIVTAPIETILDLGCGEGRFSIPLATEFNATVYGIDPSQKMLSLARKRDHAIPRVKYVQGCGEQIPLDDNEVSLVFMSMVLHHLESKDKTIAEIKRVLSNNGYLVIRNVTKEDINQIDFLNYFPAAKQIDLQRMPTEEEIVTLFKANDFNLISCSIVKQLFAQDYHEYYDKIGRRGLSALALISDKEVNMGLTRLKRYCEQKPMNEKVYEKIHLFIFQK
jgi:ubiquinone/menaquinone biosynthesis C-methylase UbiE